MVSLGVTGVVILSHNPVAMKSYYLDCPVHRSGIQNDSSVTAFFHNPGYRLEFINVSARAFALPFSLGKVGLHHCAGVMFQGLDPRTEFDLAFNCSHQVAIGPDQML